jgi:hypothetical protein
MRSSNLRFIRLLQQLGLLGILLFVAAGAHAQNLRLDLRLIWGSNETNASLQTAEPKIIEGLTNIFKWTNYYQITNKSATLAPNTSQTVDISSKCRLEIKNLGGEKIEVTIVGEGQALQKVNQPLDNGKWVALAGPDKNNNAYFICIRSKKPDEKD